MGTSSLKFSCEEFHPSYLPYLNHPMVTMKVTHNLAFYFILVIALSDNSKLYFILDIPSNQSRLDLISSHD